MKLRRIISRAVLAWLVLQSSPAWAQGPAFLVKDINTNPAQVSSSPRLLTRAAGKIFFTADDESHGRELWRSDGTGAGTWLVSNIAPGPDSLYVIVMLDEVEGEFFFVTRDLFQHTILWKTDGTPNGTVQIRSVPLASNVGVSGEGSALAVGGTLFFATPGMLWKTDGSEAGTGIVKEFHGDAFNIGPQLLTDAGGVLLFFAPDAEHGWELWRSDGTEAGTQLIRDINPGPQGSLYLVAWPGERIVPLNDSWLFTADDGSRGAELWRTDGTEAGTYLVKDIAPGGTPSAPFRLQAANGALYFTADDGVHGQELWRSDGTESGTALVRDIVPGPEGSDPGNVVAAGDVGLFQATTPETGYELWRTDGTDVGTQIAADLSPGPDSTGIADLTGLGGSAVFRAQLGIPSGGPSVYSAADVWRSDGTSAGTFVIRQFAASGSGGFVPLSASGPLLFAANEGRHGVELWKTDGTVAGTTLVKDVNAVPGSSSPNSFADLDGTLLFSADDGNGGRGLWRSDATDPGTQLLRRFVDTTEVGQPSPGPYDLVTAYDRVLFFADDGEHGSELWVSDGSTAGTTLLRDINPNPNRFRQHCCLTPIGTQTFFVGSDSQHGSELWVTDGTTEGTRLIKDIVPGVPGSLNSLLEFADFDGRVVFGASDGARGGGLWISDGTEAGTIQLGSVLPANITVVGDRIYFTAGTAALWKSDGTPAGTMQVGPNFPPTSLSELTGLGSMLLFSGFYHLYGNELWRTDGIAGHTQVVRDINVGKPSAFPTELTSVGDAVLFRATDGNGAGLWRTDGTPDGTLLLKGGAPPPFGLGRLFAGADRLFFFTTSATHTRPPRVSSDLWTSDGSSSGTRLVHPQLVSSEFATDPSSALVSGNYLYLAADDAQTGTELWALPLAALSAACVGDCDGSHTVTVDELVRGVSMALGSVSVDDCTSFDVNRDDAVTVDELVAAVGKALNGC